jgi:hypothetical protein
MYREVFGVNRGDFLTVLRQSFATNLYPFEPEPRHKRRHDQYTVVIQSKHKADFEFVGHLRLASLLYPYPLFRLTPTLLFREVICG